MIPFSIAGTSSNYYKEGSPAPASTEKSSDSEKSSSSSSSEKSSASSSEKSSSSSSSEKSSSSSSSEKSSSSSSSSGSSLGEKVAAYAQKFKGYRYVYGGAAPSTGFDCSGMVYYIYKQFGYNVGRTSTAQYTNGYPHVSRANLKPGDIVLFERTYTASCPATHSGIYLGDGYFIHAANSRLGVIVTKLDTDYYTSRFLCGVRIG